MHDALAYLSKKLSIKSESSGGFCWKLFPVQRERRGQHQLIVNLEGSNTRFSNAGAGLWNSNQCSIIFKINTSCWKEVQSLKSITTCLIVTKWNFTVHLWPCCDPTLKKDGHITLACLCLAVVPMWMGLSIDPSVTLWLWQLWPWCDQSVTACCDPVTDSYPAVCPCPC